MKKNSEIIICQKKKKNDVVLTTGSVADEEPKLDIIQPASSSSMGEKRQRDGESIAARRKHMISTGHTRQTPVRKKQRQENCDANVAKPINLVLSDRKLLGNEIFQFVGEQEWFYVAMVCLEWCNVYRESFKVAQTGLLNTLHSLSRLKYAYEQIGFDPSFFLVKNIYGVPWNLKYWAGHQAELEVVRHIKSMCNSNGSDACRGAAQAGRKSLLREFYVDGDYAFEQDILYYAAMSNTNTLLRWLHKKEIGIWNGLSMSVCLMTAAMYGRISNAKWLIKMGASWRSHSGYWTKIRGHRRFLKWALRNGCTIEPLSYLHSPAVIPAVSPSPSLAISLAIDKQLATARSKVIKSLNRTPPVLQCTLNSTFIEEGEIIE